MVIKWKKRDEKSFVNPKTKDYFKAREYQYKENY